MEKITCFCATDIICISNSLKELGVRDKIFNSSNFGLPQNRERVFIVAFHNSLNSSNFKFPIPPNTPITLKDILEEKENLKNLNIH
jgi:DNA (cytosine-5)-methyltransferase 1